jgi:hypothetical protein
MFFDKTDGSFRSGKVEADEWDAAYRGSNSFASGQRTVASGDYSHSSGYGTIADQPYARAENYFTYAYGNSSHAEGRFTKAQGYASHAEGYVSITYDYGDHAEGNICIARSGLYSGGANYSGAAHSEGQDTEAWGPYGSHAEGWSSRASGSASHAEGYVTFCYGPYSHTEGNGCVVNSTSESAHAEGYDCNAYADYSHAEGNSCEANGASSHAQGVNTETEGEASFSMGFDSIARLDNSKATAGNSFNVFGDSQNIRVNCGASTTNATPKELSLDYVQATSDITIPTGYVWGFTVRVTGIASGGDYFSAWFSGAAQNSAGTVTVNGTPLNPKYTANTAGAAAWTVQITSDAADKFNIVVTGAAATNIRWVAEIMANEIAYDAT